jgi:hypothetical protein
VPAELDRCWAEDWACEDSFPLCLRKQLTSQTVFNTWIFGWGAFNGAFHWFHVGFRHWSEPCTQNIRCRCVVGSRSQGLNSGAANQAKLLKCWTYGSNLHKCINIPNIFLYLSLCTLKMISPLVLIGNALSGSMHINETCHYSSSAVLILPTSSFLWCQKVMWVYRTSHHTYWTDTTNSANLLFIYWRELLEKNSVAVLVSPVIEKKL